MFPPLSYLEWIKGRPSEATHDLGSSDLRPAGPATAGIPDRLESLSHPDSGPSLRDSIAAEYNVPADQVLVTAGATQANLLTAATAVDLASPVDPTPTSTQGNRSESAPDSAPQVLVETPGYEPLVRTPQGLGARLDRFTRPLPEAPLLPRRAREAADDDLALITVSNRHNPTGRLSDRSALADIAEIGLEHNGYLLVDEVYAPYVTEAVVGSSSHSGTDGSGMPRGFGGPTGAGLPRTVVTGSLTKFHGLGDLRVGWIIAPETFIGRTREIASHFPAIAGPSRALARRFFANRDILVGEARAHLRTNAELLVNFLGERSDLTGSLHDGSPFGLVTHESLDGSELAALAWAEGILLVPGRFFDVPESVRVSLGRDPTTVSAALDAFETVLDDI